MLLGSNRSPCLLAISSESALLIQVLLRKTLGRRRETDPAMGSVRVEPWALAQPALRRDSQEQWQVGRPGRQPCHQANVTALGVRALRTGLRGMEGLQRKIGGPRPEPHHHHHVGPARPPPPTPTMPRVTCAPAAPSRSHLRSLARLPRESPCRRSILGHPSDSETNAYPLCRPSGLGRRNDGTTEVTEGGAVGRAQGTQEDACFVVKGGD